MKKIIFVPFIGAFGGVERLILSLAKHLHENGVSYTLLCFKDTIHLADYADWPVEIVQLNPPRNSIVEGWYLNRYLRLACGDVASSVLVFDLNGAFYAGMFSPSGYTLHLTDPPSLLATDISKNAPSVSEGTFFSIRGLWAEAVHRLNRHGVRKAKQVIVMTHVIKNEIKERYGIDARIVRPGIQVTSEPRNAMFDEKNFHFLSVSRLEENKRIDWIIKSLHHMECSSPPLSERINWILDVVGSGSKEQDLKLLVDDLGLNGRIVFHGRVSDEKLDLLYEEANIFLMPAVQGYGLPALESLSKGVPVVMHLDSGVSEILDGSSWVSMISDNECRLDMNIEALIQRLLNNELIIPYLPSIPTDGGWSEEICSIWNEI